MDTEAELANSGPWTRFFDMHSGGSQKEDWALIYIQAPQAEAEEIFYQRFGHRADRVTCNCCGEDYSVTEHDTFKQASGHYRHCDVAWFRDGEQVSVGRHDYMLAMPHGITSRYVEEPWSPRLPVISCLDFINKEDVLLIRASEIKTRGRVVSRIRMVVSKLMRRSRA